MTARSPASGLAARLAIAFAAVAVGTAAAVAVAAPPIVGRGFAMMQAGASFAPGTGRGAGMGMGPGAAGSPGAYVAQAQQEATTTIVLVAVAAAVIASVIGIAIAWWITRPLVRLEHAASRVAGGDLTARSGVTGRSDEVGSLGRSFDAMASDLERNEASRRRFFADAAHEMKTPLAVIEATTAAVLDGVYPHDDAHLATIRDQARILGRVVDDLRTVSLAEAGALPMSLTEINLAGLASSVIQSFTARAEAKSIVLVADAPDTTLDVRADADRLRQALGALLDNALRYAPARSPIRLRCERSPSGASRARISVVDGGPGIAPADLPHVFDRFYQADPARDRGTTTSGLGLAIVKALVEAQGGVVGAENAPGGGAAVWVELPLAG